MMRKRDWKRSWKTVVVCLTVASVLLSGCNNGNVASMESQTETNVDGSEAETSGNGGASVKIEPFMIGETEVTVEEDDYYLDWSKDDVTYIKLSDTAVSIEGNGAEADGNTVRIQDGGTYVLSGNWTDGSIQVDVEGKGTVRLVMNGVEIHSEESAPLYVLGADKTVISLEEGTVNTLSDSEGLVYTDSEKEEPNAAVFIRSDLTINGNGKLVVDAAFDHGINGKEKVLLMSGEYQVTSAGSAFKGKDLLAALDGSYTITAGNDGMHSDGNLGIIGGIIDIVESVEGLEGGIILIDNGDISLKASDDGINAASDEEITPALYINGGTVVVDAEGDGIDSNGDIYMTGGEVTVYGPESHENGALDYDGVMEMSGGQLAAFGMSGMARTVSEGSDQSAVMMTYEEEQSAGTEVVLENEGGEELYRWTGEKAFDSVVISVPDLKIDESYVLKTGENEVAFVLENAVTYLDKDGVTDGQQMRKPGQSGENGGRKGGLEGERPEGAPEGKAGEKPEGAPEGKAGERPEGVPEGKAGERPEGAQEGKAGERPEGAPEGRNGERPEKSPGWKNGDRSEGSSNAESGNTAGE